jgi:sortase A
MNASAERGGPVGRNGREARNWMRACAPGIAVRCHPAESSPLGRGRSGAFPGRGRRIALPVLIVLVACAGLAALGGGLYIHAKAQVAQVLLHAAWSRSRATGTAVRPWPWADTRPIARLIAPGQHSDLLVLSGASGRTLAFGPGHLDGSAAPGGAGNSIITGHRDTHFHFLQHVGAGDVFIVEGINGAQARFRVRRTYVADFRALELPRDTAVPTLTLVTCFPFETVHPGGPLRYVVVAEAA